jgi:hypothetical protein
MCYEPLLSNYAICCLYFIVTLNPYYITHWGSTLNNSQKEKAIFCCSASFETKSKWTNLWSALCKLTFCGAIHLLSSFMANLHELVACTICNTQKEHFWSKPNFQKNHQNLKLVFTGNFWPVGDKKEKSNTTHTKAFFFFLKKMQQSHQISSKKIASVTTSQNWKIFKNYILYIIYI